MDQEKFAQALFLRRLLPVWDQLPEGQKDTYRKAAGAHLNPTEPAKPSRLIPDWRSALRLHSVKLAVLAPIALEGVWYVLSSAPPELRAYIKLPVFVAFGALAIVARLWKQDE